MVQITIFVSKLINFQKKIKSCGILQIFYLLLFRDNCHITYLLWP